MKNPSKLFPEDLCRVGAKTPADKDFGMNVLSKCITDAEAPPRLHQTYGVRYTDDRVPYRRAEGVEEVLRRTPGNEAREAKTAAFFDNSLLQELEQSGWFKTFGR